IPGIHTDWPRVEYQKERTRPLSSAFSSAIQHKIGGRKEPITIPTRRQGHHGHEDHYQNIGGAHQGTAARQLGEDKNCEDDNELTSGLVVAKKVCLQPAIPPGICLARAAYVHREKGDAKVYDHGQDGGN
ncbi:unnamed protein product, partial [Amoebophrya sp. A25]